MEPSGSDLMPQGTKFVQQEGMTIFPVKTAMVNDNMNVENEKIPSQKNVKEIGIRNQGNFQKWKNLSHIAAGHNKKANGNKGKNEKKPVSQDTNGGKNENSSIVIVEDKNKNAYLKAFKKEIEKETYVSPADILSGRRKGFTNIKATTDIKRIENFDFLNNIVDVQKSYWIKKWLVLFEFENSLPVDELNKMEFFEEISKNAINKQNDCRIIDVALNKASNKIGIMFNKIAIYEDEIIFKGNKAKVTSQRYAKNIEHALIIVTIIRSEINTIEALKVLENVFNINKISVVKKKSMGINQYFLIYTKFLKNS
jgi:hypothetical protein